MYMYVIPVKGLRILKICFQKLSERKKQPTPVKEIEKKDEEDWCLSDVIFVEDARTVPIGRVIKVSSVKNIHFRLL